MTSYAESRRELHGELREALSAESAAFLMDSIPLAPFSDVVRRDALDAFALSLRSEMGSLALDLREEMGELRTELREEMGELRTELREEMGELRTEMAELKSELRGEMGELRGEMSELRGEMSELKVEVRGEMHEFKGAVALQFASLETKLSSQMQRQFAILLGLMLSLFAIMITMSGLALFG